MRICGFAIFPYFRHYNDNKLQSRSTKYIVLGYAADYKGAICYNLTSKKLVLSRHVLHDESAFPAKLVSSQSSIYDQRVILVSNVPIIVNIQQHSPTTVVNPANEHSVISGSTSQLNFV